MDYGAPAHTEKPDSSPGPGMTLELLKTELARAEDAETHSADQIRRLALLVDRAAAPNASISAADCARLVNTALALNSRLHDHTNKLRARLATALQPVLRLPQSAVTKP